MSIKAIILTRNKRVIKKDIGFYDEEREIEGYDYWLDPNLVANKMEGESLKDQEVIYFEGNPTPVTLVEEIKEEEIKGKIIQTKTGNKILWDNSLNILGGTVVNNCVKQTSGYKKKRVSSRLIIYLLIGFVIVSSLVWLFAFGGLKTLGF